ncbi:uncharacterized protein FRV6_16247 [Fusarium oxysporum]|uniref:Uncharacterized protein n=1 Tax=Fusarium oxysporum TaxID=5507 RepID=A0A2H3UE68_FUSOX|nr:uncharacterized protein FRV6_16247 [Fusarium oxysporum]
MSRTPTASLAARKCARLQPPLSVHLSVNEQWNGPGWLPPDIHVGIVFVNLTRPPDGVVCFLHKITDILLKQLVPLHEEPFGLCWASSASSDGCSREGGVDMIESSTSTSWICIPKVVKIPGPLGLPVNDTEVSDLPATSIEVDRGACPISSPSPSTDAQFAVTTALVQRQDRRKHSMQQRASESYINSLCDKLDADYMQTDEGGPAKWRRSIIIDHAEKERYTHLDKVTKH